MVVFNASVLRKTDHFCGESSVTPNSNSLSIFRKSPLRNHRNLSLFFLKIPSWSFSSISSNRKLQITASFRRPSKRRNSLREKLVASEDQVRKTPEVLNPDFNWQTETWASNSNLDSHGEMCGTNGKPDLNLQTENISSSFNQGDNREAPDGDGSVKEKLPGASVLWSKLENWVDQYKNDSEFWGIGSGPVFTVIQDSDGNVVRVSVNEDEIVKRSRVETWSFQPKENGEEFTDVNVKISRAKLIAEEIVSGAYTLPRNSSIAKFVTEGKRSSFLDGFRSFTPQGKPLLKLSPYLGFMMFCSCFVFWVVKKLSVGNDRKELTSEERQMLRRKMKSRMERDKVEKGSVEILQNVQELPLVLDRRPELDKNELMKNLMKAKLPRESFISDSSGHFNTEDHNFEDKVNEIRAMARRVRELERQEHLQIDKKGEDNDAPATLLAAEDEAYAIKSDVDVEAGHVVDGSDGSDVSKTISTPDDTTTMDFATRMEKSKMLREKSLDSIEYIADEKSGNGHLEAACMDDFETDSEECLNKIPVSVDVENTNPQCNARTLNMEIFENELQIEQDLHGRERIILNTLGRREKIEANHSHPDNSSSSSKSSKRMKPKIIRSVREAREYLNKKCTVRTNEKQSDRLAQVESLHVGPDVHGPAYTGEPDGKASLTNSERTEVVESPKLDMLQGPKKKVPAFESQHAEDDPVVEGNSINGKKSILDDMKEELHLGEEGVKMHQEKDPNLSNNISDRESEKPHSFSGGIKHSSMGDLQMGETGYSSDIFLRLDAEDNDSCANSGASDYIKERETHHISSDKSSSLSTSSVRKKPRITKSVKESSSLQSCSTLTDKRSYDQEVQGKIHQVGIGVCDIINTEELNCQEYLTNGESKTFESFELDMKSDPTSVVNSSEDSIIKTKDISEFCSQSLPINPGTSEDLEPSAAFNAREMQRDEKDHNMSGLNSLSGPRANFSQESDGANYHAEAKRVEGENRWIEKNFEEFDPIIKKIGIGFKENYMVAKEKVQEQKIVSAELSELGLVEDGEELEWMNNDTLREIVFKVRENELAGRDPFHSMDPDDQRSFFEGLERKAEKVNKKLLGLHEWVHSRIENIDYGADGISLDDPLEKIIPRWKGPPIDKDPDFLTNFAKHRKAFFAEHVGMSHAANGDIQDRLCKSEEVLYSDGVSPSSPVNSTRKLSEEGTSKNPKTVIECSDGSVRAGKKSGKEHWQHTKKWSREFLELYNAETDLEIKSVMKDMGKDLDKWITEKEVQDVADLMTRIPKRKRRYIEKKLDKVKKEMEMFGPQAVVSKYKEYSEEKEEDYLWWLDLRFLLCIELYTIEEGVQKVGFYSLEMAADLELNPKQYHVIAFEDPGDSRNFCCIIQAHLEMLGNGSAFVVARPPKDAFREAKADGFQITVIRKGELKLNIDQTLEEVEEEIVEIGSKMYHDKIMRERSVDIGGLMKGVFGAGKSTKRSSRRILQKPAISN